MTTEQALAFLEALRVKNVFVKDNGWVVGSCPLAKWTHKNRTDHSPSFGINITPGGHSYFMCFACRQGSVEELVSMLEMYTQTYVDRDYDFVRCHQILSEEEYVVPLPAYGEFGPPGHTFTEWPAYWLDSFQKAEWVDTSLNYLTHRGVSMTTIKQFDLRFDPKRQMIVAPYMDVFGRLAGARGRCVDPLATKKHHDYSFQNVNNARLVWFHEPVLNMSGPVVVVEGQFDVFRVSQVFPKVVANLSSKPTLEKMKKLSDSRIVIQIPDRDDAGAESVHVYAKFCHQLGMEHRVVHLDPGAKDPDDCHPSYLKDKIAAVTG